MSASDEPKRATDLMSTTRATSACGPPHRLSSFSKFIEALRLDEEIEDGEEEDYDYSYNDDVHVLPPADSTHTSTTKTTMSTFTLQTRCNHHQQHSSGINIKAPSAKDILRSIDSETYHHSDSDVNVQDTETERRMSTGKGRHFLHANHLSTFIMIQHSDIDKGEQEMNAAIKAICSLGSEGPVRTKTTSKRQASFHDALVDIILTEQAKISQDGENAEKKSSGESSNRANFASDLQRRISDEIEWRHRRLSANMA